MKTVYLVEGHRFPVYVCKDNEIEQGVKDGEFINEVGDEFYYYHVKVI